MGHFPLFSRHFTEIDPIEQIKQMDYAGILFRQMIYSGLRLKAQEISNTSTRKCLQYFDYIFYYSDIQYLRGSVAAYEIKPGVGLIMIFFEIQRQADVLLHCDTGLHHGDAYGKTRCQNVFTPTGFFENLFYTDVVADI